MILEPDQQYYEDGVYRWSAAKLVAAWDDCCRRLVETLATQAIVKVVILVGLPGAGKSTYAQAHDADDVIIFDAMFVDRARRSRVLGLAAAAGVPVEAVSFDVPWEVCRQRNDRRSSDRRIPDDVLLTMRQQLEADPPRLEEGFVALKRVTTA